MRVRRLFHRRRLGVVPVGDLGQIAAQFFEQGDEFGGFLLASRLTCRSNWARCSASLPWRVWVIRTMVVVSKAPSPTRPWSQKYHIPPGLVVDRWASNGENGSHRHFLFRQDGWTMVRHQISKEITSVISTAWYFTTQSGGIWFGQDAAKGRVMEIVTRTVRDEEHMRYSCVAYLSLTVTIGGVNK
jgi:hypothetical protein